MTPILWLSIANDNQSSWKCHSFIAEPGTFRAWFQKAVSPQSLELVKSRSREIVRWKLCIALKFGSARTRKNHIYIYIYIYIYTYMHTYTYITSYNSLPISTCRHGRILAKYRSRISKQYNISGTLSRSFEISHDLAAMKLLNHLWNGSWFIWCPGSKSALTRVGIPAWRDRSGVSGSYTTRKS